MSTVTRHYKHGRIELHQGNSWWVYVETNESDEYEFLGTAGDLKQAEEMYYHWWEE